MSSSRTPPHKTVTRMPSLGSSFASCFGATVPVSPRPAGGHASPAAQAGINYRRLRLDDFGDEDQCGYGARACTEYQDQGHSENEHFRQGGVTTIKLGKHSSFKERATRRSEMLYASEGEHEKARERKGVLKLGKQRAMREKAGSGRYSASETSEKKNVYGSEGENYECGRQRKYVMEEVVRKNAAMEVYGNSGRERGEMRVKTGSKREKAVNGEVGSDSPRRASFGTKMREACVQVLETARRGSPHLSELFVGNQLLMQVTASSFNSRHAKRMAPSYGFHVFTVDPSISPAHSTSSAF